MPTEAPPAPSAGEITLGKPSTALSQSLTDKLKASAAKYAEPPESTPATPAKPAAPEPPAKPPTQSTPPEKPEKKADEPKGRDEGPKELREALDRARAKLAEAEADGTLSKKAALENQAALTKIKEDLARREKEIEEDLKPRAQRLTEAEKRLQEKEAILRIRDYTATDEWREKFDKPLAAARADVESLMGELEVRTENGSRRATFDDFAPILKAATVTQADQLAEQIFGPRLASIVVNKRTEIQSLNRAREAALKTAELDAENYHKQRQVRQAQDIEDRKNRLNAAYAKIVESDPDVFKPADGDTEAADAIREGLNQADRFINGDPKMTPDEFISTIAELRADSARSKVQKKLIARKDAKIKELEAQLKEFRGSEPGVGGGTEGAPVAKKTDRESVLADMAQRALKYAR